MNRFNKFLSFLEDPASLNTEELQLIQEHINSFPEFTPNIPDELVLSWAYSEFNFELKEDRQLCMQIMKSPIFHRGGLKNTVSKPATGWKIYDIENIECFIMHLSSIIKRNGVNYKSTLAFEVLYKSKKANSIKPIIEHTKFIVNLLPSLKLASEIQVSLLITQIDELINTINNKTDK